MASNKMKGYCTKAESAKLIKSRENIRVICTLFSHLFMSKMKGAIVFSTGGFKQSVYSQFAMLSEILDIFSILA